MIIIIYHNYHNYHNLSTGPTKVTISRTVNSKKMCVSQFHLLIVTVLTLNSEEMFFLRFRTCCCKVTSTDDLGSSYWFLWSSSIGCAFGSFTSSFCVDYSRQCKHFFFDRLMFSFAERMINDHTCGWNNNKPPIWEWFGPPLQGDLGDGLLLFKHIAYIHEWA